MSQSVVTYSVAPDSAGDASAVAVLSRPGRLDVAFSAIEAGRFLVQERQPPQLRLGLRAPNDEVVRAWVAFADALSRIPQPLECWQVLSRPGSNPDAREGAAIAVGWLALGRDADRTSATRQSLATLETIAATLAAHCDFFTIAPVRQPDRLAALLRPSLGPSLRAFRRLRWEPPVGVTSERDARPEFEPGVLVPWTESPGPWSPLLDALALTPHECAFVVRFATSPGVPRGAVHAAERDLLGVQQAHLAVLADSPHDSAPVADTADAMMRAAAGRLKVLEGPCLLAEAGMSAPSPPSPSLLATAASALTGSATEASASEGRVGLLPAPPVALLELTEDSWLDPLDGHESPTLVLGPREAVALIRTPEPPADERSPLRCSRARTLPLRCSPDEGTRLGEGDGRGSTLPARLPLAERFQHVYVVGQTGTGKSTLLLNMVLDDLAAGHGLTLLDPHGSLVRDVLDRVPAGRARDVIVMDPSDEERTIGLNPLDFGAADEATYVARRDAAIDDLLDTFDALYDLQVAGGPMFEQYFRLYMGILLGTSPPSDYQPLLPMLIELMSNRAVARALTARTREADPVAALMLPVTQAVSGDASLANMVPYVVSKLSRFYSSRAARRVLCQGRGLDFAQVIAEKRVLLVHVSPARVGIESSAMIARQVIAKLSAAAMRHGPGHALPPHFIYADEFHHFATERFAALLAEARKFRVGLVLAHQYTSQLVRKGDRRVLDAVLGNVGTAVLFRLGAQDAQLLDEVVAPRADAADIAALPNYEAIVKSVGRLGHVPFTLHPSPAPPVTRSLAAEIIARSRQEYGLPVADVDRELVRQLERLRALAEK